MSVTLLLILRPRVALHYIRRRVGVSGVGRAALLQCHVVYRFFACLQTLSNETNSRVASCHHVTPPEGSATRRADTTRKSNRSLQAQGQAQDRVQPAKFMNAQRAPSRPCICGCAVTKQRRDGTPRTGGSVSVHDSHCPSQQQTAPVAR